MKGQYYGKFRGTVMDNADPLMIGRLMVMVPDVSNVIPSTWAMPCFPFAGIQNGFYAVPQIGAGVWVEYEQGDPDYPIWSGCFLGTVAETPAMALATPTGLQGIVIQTVGQNTLMISDAPGPTGGFLLKTTAGALLSISDAGIMISNGQGASIVMEGPSITFNEGALAVT